MKSQSQGASICIGLLLMAAAMFVPAQRGAAEGTPDKAVFGYWKSLDEDTHKPLSIFRLWEDKGKLVAKIVKMFPKPNGDPPPQTCAKCSGNQKDKPMVGLLLMWGLALDKDNPRKWTDGKVLNPEDGRTYNVEVEVSPDGKALKVYGYLNLLVKLGGTRVWERPTQKEMEGVATPGSS